MMKWMFLVSLVGACGYARPQAHETDAAVDGASDTAAACTDCQLVAIEPAVANAGDTVMLEGTFTSGAIVHFPGGVTAAATVLGAHRATAVVPPGATNGDLTVVIGAGTLGPLPFRRASFPLGLQSFQQFDDQTNGARQMTSLVAPRMCNAAIAVNGVAYAIGGINAAGAGLTSVESARINGDGSLGQFATVPNVALTQSRGLMQNATVVVGNYVYVLGGSDSNGMALGTIERAPIHADGSLGSFAVVPGVTLVRPRYNHTVSIVGNTLVVTGGSTGVAPYFLDSVEAAPIHPDGSLGAFAEVGHLVVAREAHSALVVGGSLYIFGGDTTAGGAPAIGSIERAAILADGSLGAFASAGQLATPRQSAAVWQLGATVFIAGGGGNAGAQTSVESANIQADGTLGAFATSPASTLAVGEQCGGAVVSGNHAYLIGGVATSATAERASIDVGGGLGAPATATFALSTARDRYARAVIGSNLYLVGGSTNDTTLSSVERAPIASDGSLGAFTTLTSTSLVTPRDEPALAVIGSYLYVLGGAQAGGGPFIASVERAPINADGSLGAFATVSGVTLVTARDSFQTVVAGSWLYVIGGYDGSSVASIERAAINADGSLGTFSTVSSALIAGRNAFATMVADRYLYVIGGCQLGHCPLASIERAALATDGSIGAFATVSSTLATARYGFALVVAGSRVYTLGGEGTAPSTRIESATIDNTGTLAGFASTTAALATPRVYAAAVSLGNFTYVIGGQNGTSLASAEQGALE